MQQRLLIPTYFNPAEQQLWQQALDASEAVGLIVIINPYNGPGSQYDAAYKNLVQTAQARGVTVLGYVHTEYGRKALSQVAADIDSHFDWFGLDGIFVDEVASDDSQLYFYRAIQDHVATHPPRNGRSRPWVVLNPGTTPVEGYAALCDILVTFEGAAAGYRAWRPARWAKRHPPDKFCHLLHSAREPQTEGLLARSKRHGVGWVFVTPAGLPNPWDKLPSGAAWEELLRLADSGPVAEDSGSCCMS